MLLGVITNLNGEIIVEEKIQLQTTHYKTIFPMMINLIRGLMNQVRKSLWCHRHRCWCSCGRRQKGEILLT